MNWYKAQCNGDWEHQFGVKIDTLDNPGWTLEVDLLGTSLEGALAASETGMETDPDRWLHVSADGSVFRATCGPLALDRAIHAFVELTER